MRGPGEGTQEAKGQGVRRYWMTTTEAADAFGVTRQTVGNWVKAGKVQSTKLGRFRMVKVDDITEIMRRRVAS